MCEDAAVTTFGQRLRRARLAKGLTQDEVARHLGIRRVNVTKWESDDYMPGTRRIGALAAVLEVSEDWLLSDKGDPPAPSPTSKIHEAEQLLRLLAPEDLEREIAYLRSRLAG
jgi:transcriptional regulator with XRE-family HTH domain